jgi:endonuclease YncB( thermonuclease family)
MGEMTLTAALLCTLISVTDGDTFKAACPEPVIVRIANIDAPERKTCPRDAGLSASALASLLIGTIAVQPLYDDRYGRTVANVTVRGMDVGDAMIDVGAAKPWPHSDTGRALESRPEWRGCR